MTTVLISGANRGIGLEFARQYAADGAHVIAGVRNPDGAGELKAIGGVEVFALDVGDDASVARFREQVGARAVDILIANAGLSGHGRFGDFDFAAWLELLNVNALGPTRLAQAFAANLKAGRERKLVAITSVMGSTAGAAGDMIPYRASKAVLSNIWANLAVALKGDGIVCLPLHPGWVQTDMGGAGAEVTPRKSVDGMRRLIAEAGPADSGVLRDYAGEGIAW